jgi:hypothetical protein
MGFLIRWDTGRAYTNQYPIPALHAIAHAGENQCEKSAGEEPEKSGGKQRDPLHLSARVVSCELAGQVRAFGDTAVIECAA